MSISKRQLLGSMAWKSIEKAVVQVTRLVIEIVMARVLIPSDFGTFTLLLTCIALANIVIEGGLGNALIQKDHIDNIDINSAFWIMNIVALVFFCILFFGASIIGDFYNNQAITKYLKVIAVIVFPASFNSIQLALATREMRFKDIFIANAVAIIISGSVGIVFAIKGFGVWSLIIQYSLQLLIGSIVFCIYVRWIPQFEFSLSRGKSLYSFGWKIMCSNLLNRGYGEIYNLVIGKVFSTTVLGFYNRGKVVPSAIENGLTSVVITVLFPFFSRQQNDIEKTRTQMDKCIRIMMFIVAPVFLGLAAVADPLIRLLLTEKWIKIVPIFQVLCLGLLFQPISHINTTVINSIGRSDIVLKLEIIKRAVGLLILIISVRFNVVYVAIGLSVSYFFNMIINVHQNSKLIQYSFIDLIKSITPSICVSVIMSAIVTSTYLLHIENSILLLSFQVVVGVITYTLLSFFLNNTTFKYILNTMKKVLFQNA